MSDQFVYFTQADEDGPIKIGFTSDDPMRRLAQLQTGNPATLKLLGAIRGSSAREKEFHAALSQWRLQGEWFEAHPTVLAAINDALSSHKATNGLDEYRCCSFCFRWPDELGASILVAGPAANICEECLTEAAQTVAALKAETERVAS
jgi:hypothetical protein